MNADAAPDFSAYTLDDRMVVQILLINNEWLTVSEPCVPSAAVIIAHDVLAAGQDVNHLRITMAVHRW